MEKEKERNREQKLKSIHIEEFSPRRGYLAQARDQRSQTLATGQFSLRREYLAQASSSRLSEVSLAQGRDQKSEVYLGGFQQL
ncbi:hypothetical protein Lalb_Chr22g0357501 [Lupinus albus]|uniref:Uncharacterized protein n=1 Tax=Lupinus albus TaxID=3870 RepID=A0A6A4NGQ5_LUPAL|nr:hypothetical protein Lalb_Chr22g0357501 [Lupinus albus]